MTSAFKNYLAITAGYWAFTLTDGAIRMLVVLYFYQLGYSPLEIALLFLFYEISGVLTNFIAGWLGARFGLNKIMHAGMLLQVVALGMLAVPENLLSVAYVMFAQALSGIAKDLNKMSAKASVKLMLPEDAGGRLFRWVSYLTGSKNALKGVGFFLGGLLLSLFGFQNSLIILSGSLFIIFLITLVVLPNELGKAKTKIKFKHLFSKSQAINRLSAARIFLFAARDVWFVVALPVYLSSVLGWQHSEVGAFFAFWVIGYGLVQSSAPAIVGRAHHSQGPDGATARFWAFILFVELVSLAALFSAVVSPGLVVITGLVIFAFIFAINSAVHSFLILDYSSHEQVSVDVGFYYMANASGRLLGTVLSGWVFQIWGLAACLWVSAAFILLTTLISKGLPTRKQELSKD